MLKATFRQLEMFVAVVETGGFTNAAIRLGVSPAAISDQIRALEQRMDCQLFDRRPGTTPALNGRGEQLLQHARQLLDSAAKVAALCGSEVQPLLTAKLTADEYIAERLLRPILPKFQKDFPGIQIEFLQLNFAADVVHSIRSGRTDLAYITLWTLDVDWPIDVISTVEVGLYLSPLHPLASSWTTNRQQKLPLITPIAGSPMERVMSKSLLQAGLTNFESVAHTQYGATMAELARDGVGVCYVMREAVTNQVKAGELVELDANLPAVHRCALRRTGALEIEHLRQVDKFAVALIRAMPAKQ
jgi:LysR family transcriptional regulator, low CO2-responsive transcriptional regulator